MNRSKKAALVVASAATLLLATPFIPAIQGMLSPPSVQATMVCDSSVALTSTVHYYTLDPNKEVTLAFGPTADMGSIPADLQELCKRIQVDPALASGVEATVGMIPVTLAATDAEETLLMQDRTHWRDVINQLVTLINTTTVATTQTPAGVNTLDMAPNGDNSFVHLYKAYTVAQATTLVFTKPDGSTFELRLPCGFQPVFTSPPSFPACQGAEGCTPPTPQCPYGVAANGHCQKGHADDPPAPPYVEPKPIDSPEPTASPKPTNPAPVTASTVTPTSKALAPRKTADPTPSGTPAPTATQAPSNDGTGGTVVIIPAH